MPFNRLPKLYIAISPHDSILYDVNKQRGQRGDNLVAMIKVEWNEKTIGESVKVECTADSPAELNHASSITINFDDPHDLDDIAYKPALCKTETSLADYLYNLELRLLTFLSHFSIDY